MRLADIPDTSGSTVVYSYSLGAYLSSLGFFLGSLGYFVLYRANWYILGAYAGSLAPVYSLAMPTVVLLAFVAFFVTRREWTVKFYDGSLTIKGWKTDVKVTYSEVAGISVGRAYGFLWRFMFPGVSFFIKGYPKPFIIPTNPKNKKLKTDLYSWIVAKTQQSAITQGSLSR